LRAPADCSIDTDSTACPSTGSWRPRVSHEARSTPSLTVDQARAKVERANTLLREGIDPNPNHAHPPQSIPPTGIIRFSRGTFPGATLQSEEEIVEAGSRLDQPLLVAGLERYPIGEIRRRQVAELLNKITHERDAPRSSDVVRSLISRMFRFGIANGHEEIEYNPASGTERALDTVPKRTRYPDDHHAKRQGEFKRLWTVWKEWIVTGRPLLGWQFQLRALTAQRGGEILQMRFSETPT
jgi:hypothetical protein